MTPAGTIALATMLLTCVGTVVGTWLSVSTIKRGIAKENANRRVQLEEYAVAVDHYHRSLRAYLFDLADRGVIDIRKVDLAKFAPPPVPKYNGNGK